VLGIPLVFLFFFGRVFLNYPPLVELLLYMWSYGAPFTRRRNSGQRCGCT